jgi:hypothetical protein
MSNRNRIAIANNNRRKGKELEGVEVCNVSWLAVKWEEAPESAIHPP